MRVGIVAIQHESNTFLTAPTTWEHFAQGSLTSGAAIRTEYADSHHEVGGFYQGLDEAGIEAVGVLVAWALPGGIVTSQTLEKLLLAMLDALKQAGQLDGVLVAPHGAGVAQNAADMDGAWLRELRSRVGPQIPIVGTLDLHANLSEAMIRATDALIGYRTNPHLDQRERGVQAARLMARILRGEARPTQAAAFPPLAINIERQHTPSSPCRDCYEALDDMLADHRVLANTLLLGFPYADVAEMGSSVIVVTDDDPELAQRLADDFAEYLRLRQQDFVGRGVNVDEAIAQALSAQGPVCLLDMGDNVGGGSPGDGTVLLAALAREGVKRSLVCLYDPQAVERIIKAGIGAKLELSLGGKSDPRHGAPVCSPVRVRGLYDGKFRDPQPRHGGRTHYDMGASVVVELAAGPTVLLTSRRVPPFSLEQIASCQLDPREFQILVAKGVHAPAAAYGAVCPTLIRVDTPGVTVADMTRLDYHHRRRPMFPFERD